MCELHLSIPSSSKTLCFGFADASQGKMNPLQKIPMKLMCLTSKILSFSAVNWKLKFIREKLITRCLHFSNYAFVIAITNSLYRSLAKYRNRKNNPKFIVLSEM